MNKILMGSAIALLCLSGMQDSFGARGRGASSSGRGGTTTTTVSVPTSPANATYTSLHTQIKAMTNLPSLVAFLEPYLKTLGAQKIGTKKVAGKSDLKKLRDALKALGEGNASTATKKVTAALKVFTNDYFSKDPLSKMVIEQAVTILSNTTNFPQTSPVYSQVQQLLPNLKTIVANDKA